MGIRLIFKKYRIFLSFVAVFLAAGFCSYFSEIEFVIAASIFVFSWPMTDLIIENLASKNFKESEENLQNEWWLHLLHWCIIFGIAVAGVLGAKKNFFEALSITIVWVSPIGAILGILSEWENNAPGGFNNPHQKSDDSSNDADS